MLKWLILTCDATKKIVGAQKHLLKKYVPEFQFDYLDLQSKPVSTWCKNVYDLLEPYDDEYIIFGLDETLTNPHWVTGQVAHPKAALSANHAWACL